MWDILVDLMIVTVLRSVGLTSRFNDCNRVRSVGLTSRFNDSNRGEKCGTY